MATYTASVETRIRYTWRVPGALYGGHGAAIEELNKAEAAARHTYIEVHGAEPYYDDWLRIYAADDDIVMFFEIDKPVASQAAHKRNPAQDLVITSYHQTCTSCATGFNAGSGMYENPADSALYCPPCWTKMLVEQELRAQGQNGDHRA